MLQQPLLESASVSVMVNGGLVGAGGVSDLTGQPHGARFSEMSGEQVSASSDGYGHDFGKHPSSRRQTLERKSVLSCLVMYSAWMLRLLGCPTTCTETGMKPSTSRGSSFAALMMVPVLIRFLSSSPSCNNTEAPVSATPADWVFFILDFVGVQLGSSCSWAHWSSIGLSSTWSLLAL